MSQTQAQQKPSDDTLYFDGACPLCTREIRKLSRVQRGGITFVDVHQAEPSASLPSREILLQKLHLRTAQGDWLVGIDANIYAWRNTPYAWAWNVLKWPMIYPFAKRAYNYWAKLRYQKILADRAL